MDRNLAFRPQRSKRWTKTSSASLWCNGSTGILEDPQNETPYDGDGGYMYLWGGPFDAREQLWEKFGDIVPEALIEEVVEKVEIHGTLHWAPAPNSPFYEHAERDEEPPDEPISLDVFLDETSDRYSSPEEREARARAIEAIDNLRKALESPRPIGIGHNRPPAEGEEPEEIRELRPALQELSAELQKPNPEIALVKRWATPLRDAVIATATWSWKKLDGAVSAVFNVGAVAGAGWLYNHPEYIQIAFDAIVSWLDIAAKTLF